MEAWEKQKGLSFQDVGKRYADIPDSKKLTRDAIEQAEIVDSYNHKIAQIEKEMRQLKQKNQRLQGMLQKRQTIPFDDSISHVTLSDFAVMKIREYVALHNTNISVFFRQELGYRGDPPPHVFLREVRRGHTPKNIFKKMWTVLNKE